MRTSFTLYISVRHMLGTLRKGAHSFFAKMLMMLLVASFALWGIGDMTGSSSQINSIATVGEESISTAEFQREVQRLERSFGSNFSPDLLRNLNLYSLKLSEMINRSLIRQEVERLGITVDDEALIQELTKDTAFHNAAGQFDKPLFLKTLAQSGIREDQYIESVRTELSVRLLLDSFSNFTLVSPELAEAVYNSEYEVRQVELIRITDTPEPLEEPGEEALLQYYEAHKASYTAPEYRSFSYVTIRPDDVVKSVDISREELFDFYTQRAAEFALPEQRDTEQFLYSDKAKAEDAYRLLREGTAVAEVAAQIPPKDGKPLALGLKTHDGMLVGGDEVFALKEKGEFTAPVQSQFGWHIFVLQDIVRESTSPFDSVKDALKQEITNERASTLLMETIEQFEDELSAGKTMKEAAEAAGLTYVASDPVDRFGLRSDNSVGIERADSEALLRTVFALEQGERSEPISQPDGSYMRIELEAVTIPRERAFEEVRGQALEDIRKQNRRQALEAYATKAAGLLASSSSAEGRRKTIASIEGASVYSVHITRNGLADGQTAHKEQLEPMLHQGLIAQVFALSEAGQVSTALADADGYTIAILDAVTPPPLPGSAEGIKRFKTLRSSLREAYQSEILDQYLRYLRTRYTVTVNEAAIQSLMKE